MNDEPVTLRTELRTSRGEDESLFRNAENGEFIINFMIFYPDQSPPRQFAQWIHSKQISEYYRIVQCGGQFHGKVRF
ncbi:MAG: hypothetical protein ABIJ86_06125 [Spirochaetota bacterium]